MTVLEFVQSLGAQALTAFWLPLAAWTAVALPVWWLLSRYERATPLTQYWGRVALLLSLPAGILGAHLFSLLPEPAIPPAAGLEALSGSLSVITVTVVGDAAASPVSWWYVALGSATVLAAGLALFRMARLAADALALYRWRRSLRLEKPEASVQRMATQLSRMLDLTRGVDVRVTPADVMPVTYGIFRPTVVLPASLLADERHLRMALAHELVHVRRHDYPVHCAVLFVAALFAIHPAMAALARSIQRCREVACDAEVLSRAPTRRKPYAELLLHLADRPGSHARALSMAGSHSFLKKRIEAMSEKTFLQRSSTRFSLLAGMLLLAGVALVVACSDLLVEEPIEPLSSTSEMDGEGATVYEVVEQMPEPKGGIRDIMSRVTYPEIAQRAGVEGRVVVEFVVNETGRVVDATIIHGVGAGLDEEAVRVIEETEFTPGIQDGEAVRVTMTLPIIFRLAGGGASASGGIAPEPLSPSASSLDEITVTAYRRTSRRATSSIERVLPDDPAASDNRLRHNIHAISSQIAAVEI